MVFGNNSNDRFAALVFLPFVAGLIGLVVVAIGIASSARQLPAPYGFDIFALILVVGTAVVFLAPGSRTPRDWRVN